MNGGARKPGRPVRQLWLAPEGAETREQRVADVAIALPVPRSRTYAIPPSLEGVVQPGASVRVPHGRGRRVVDGICARVTTARWKHTRREIMSATPGPPWFTPALLELSLWLSAYYVCSPWKTLAAVFPLALRHERQVVQRYLRRVAAVPVGRITPRQEALLAVLADGWTAEADALERSATSRAILRTLMTRGLIEREERRETAPRPPLTMSAAESVPEDVFALTPSQAAAVTRITEQLQADEPFRVFLLFGVPGSGKTEVYVRTIRHVIATGRQAILLIPEIALATQIVARLARRFPRVAILHSQLSVRLRQDTLAAIAAGEVDVVIGTRNAVFAPCPRLGLIVVDEEQETSFKNLSSPYYHARDVAIMRGRLERVPVVLGSATPALETWHNATTRQHFELLRLPERVPGAELPCVVAVAHRPDEEHAATAGERGLLAPRLQRELARVLADQEQAILLYNRRGYAPYLRCTRCGTVARCERCHGHLVYHRSGAKLKCHRCGTSSPAPEHCLDAGCGGRLERAGAAIQRLEEELRARYPKARILRLDGDTMRRRDDYEAAIAGFTRREADVLLGTQMVAKGLDFPAVTLVGVLAADEGLRLPDFRAGERVFQLIVQVVGRAGRKEGRSLAIVQTAPDPPPVIGDALRQDYEAFAQSELPLRERLWQPPFTRLVRLVLADGRPGQARGEALRVAGLLKETAGRLSAALRIEEAEPCLLRQQRGRLRWQVLLRGPRNHSMQQLLQVIRSDRAVRPRVERLTIDVDPVELL
ncbi:MAG: primosomal protein N' [Phycisphaerales bacterium]|nr:primosomal protein N' [Phycisphaerales bacterium]